MMNDRIQKRDLHFAAQLRVFADKLPAHAATFGLSPELLASVQLDADWLNFATQQCRNAALVAQSWTQFKIGLRRGVRRQAPLTLPAVLDLSGAPGTPAQPDIEKRFRRLVAQLKAHDKYSGAIGEGLGIEAPKSVFDPKNYKPRGSARAVLHQVLIRFGKQGADAMAIYSRVTAGTQAASSSGLDSFIRIGVDFRSPFVDDRPLSHPGQPEVREYYLRGIKGDEEIGLPGDLIRIVVGA